MGREAIPAAAAAETDLERAVLATLTRSGRPLTCTALADLLGRRDVAAAVVELAATGRLHRARKGWVVQRLAPANDNAPTHAT